jgi:hypothetical protein
MCPSDSARNHVGAVPVSVNDTGAQTIDERTERLVFPHVIPPADYERRNRDFERIKPS